MIMIAVIAHGLRPSPALLPPKSFAHASIRHAAGVVVVTHPKAAPIGAKTALLHGGRSAPSAAVDAAAPATRRPFSSLGDSLSDLLGRAGVGRRPPRTDELLRRRFEVTRLNDVLESGLSDVVEATAGPASAEELRNAARGRRARERWEDLLRGVPAEGGRRDRAAAALDKFEAKEAERAARLGGALDAWRETRLGARKDPAEETYAEKFFKLFRRDKGENPRKALAQRLENEAELLEELRRCDADGRVVREVLRGCGADLASAGAAATVTKAPPEKGGASGTKTPEPASSEEKKFVYVLDFRGDTRASQTGRLAEEISALLSLPAGCCPSEVVLRLKSPGGTVTGYGLAAAQLMRLVDGEKGGGKGGIPLIVCVDEVAASGGYLMACTATRILCSPFAALGSIGVVASTPNVARRLETEGLTVVQKTAGKYKRTVTPWREPQPDELEKLQSDVDDIQRHFVGHVTRRRGAKLPGGDAEGVATGEVWYGPDALEQGLVDEIQTSEEYLLGKMREGCEVLRVRRIAGGEMALPPFWGGSAEEEGVLGGAAPMLRGTGTLPSFDSAEDVTRDTASLSKSALSASDSLLAQLVGSIAPKQRRALLEALIQIEGPRWR